METSIENEQQDRDYGRPMCVEGLALRRSEGSDEQSIIKLNRGSTEKVAEYYKSGDRIPKPRNPNRISRRQVPNLLSGQPLISGPVTPHFTSQALSPGSLCQANMAIFPTFMLAPSIVAEGSEQFVREAMQNAIGLPPIIYEYPQNACNLPEEHFKQSTPKKRQKENTRGKTTSSRKPLHNPPTLESSADFPLLGSPPSGTTNTIETPRVKLRWSKSRQTE